jgi:LysM repeat protein
VKAGDTLYAIAVRFGTTVAAIAIANNIQNPNQISVGQVLIIP